MTKGLLIMRRTSLIFIGAIAGAGLTLIARHPHALLGGSIATAASSAAYEQLNRFGDVYEQVRADYVEKPGDSKLVESAIKGMLAGSIRIRATWLPAVCMISKCRPAAGSALRSQRKTAW